MNDLFHYGTPRKSGRYPWGSGEDPNQHSSDFLNYVDDLRRKGLSEVEISKGMGITTSQLRARKTIAKNTVRSEERARAIRLKEKGYSNVEIGRQMNKNESSIRALLDPVLQERADILEATSKVLKDSVAKKGYIDVGLGVENHLGISRTKLKTSLEALKEEGYEIHYVQVDQAGTGKKTTIMVLAEPGTPWKDVNQNKNNIQMVTDFHTKDGGRTYYGLDPIKNVDSKSIKIIYKEDGGSEKDGLIELRRGVDDLSLGNSRYAQVRIGVDGTHFLKGMAMYSDNLPDGINILYNTNKSKDVPANKVFKVMMPDMNDPKAKAILKLKISESEQTALLEDGVRKGSIKPDPDNPFGAVIKAGGQKGVLNIVNEEGDWTSWSKSLSTQILSKQSKTLIKDQLDLAFKIKQEEYEEIMSLTNPIVKKTLLNSFADDCDSSAVHLKAAALPRQGWHVILPFPDIKETEVYAPNYRNGEKVVLIRHPHGGTFEIPELTVNNKKLSIKSIIGNAKDSIGIHPKVAERLSGADFDGDTVLVIPTNGKKIKTSPPLKGLQNFDPKVSYPGYEGMPKIKSQTKQLKMGDISNLITDMTIMGASDSEIARAVRHSMVVIDSEKHNLNYKQSYLDNGISALKKKYQGSEKAGATTLISRSSSVLRVPDRKEGATIDPKTGKPYKISSKTGKPVTLYIDPKTGKKLYTETNEEYTTKDGKLIKKTIKSTKMAEVDNAYELSSGTNIENIYASYANKLKSLANTSRKNMLETQNTPYSPSAKIVYDKEVNSLKAKLNIALKNAPIERQAQLLANKVVQLKKQNNPNLDNPTLQKIKGQAIAEARIRTGASKTRIDIQPKEWQAIQAGAVSTNVLEQILSNTDLDKVKQYATPRTTSTISPAKLAKAKAMVTSGYTQAEIADSIGISVGTLSKAMN